MPAFQRGRWWLAGALIPLSILGWNAGARQDPAPVPFRRAWWYWHHPFRLSAGEMNALHQSRCERIYVHSGTLTAHQDKLVVTNRQKFESAAPCELVVVIRIDPRSHSALLGRTGAAQLARLLRNGGFPKEVKGVQLDADIPTADLPSYARSLAMLRRELPGGWLLSVTALPDWLRSPGYKSLAASVDEIAPQFYGNRWPVVGKTPPALWETEALPERIRQSAVGPAQVWVGLPSYGRCLVLDSQGRTLGVRHDLSPEQLEDDPDWSLTHAATRGDSGEVSRVAWEDNVVFRAEREALTGPAALNAGTTLWFQWPRPSALENETRKIEALRHPRIAGACYFRWPDPGEPLTSPPTSGTGPVAPKLTISTIRKGRVTSVVIANQGGDSPLLPQGVRLEITGGGIDVISDSPVTYQLGDLPCSSLRSDRVVVNRMVLRPGSRWQACRIRDAAGTIPLRVVWRDSEGRLHASSSQIPSATQTASRSPDSPLHSRKERG